MLDNPISARDVGVQRLVRTAPESDATTCPLRPPGRFGQDRTRCYAIDACRVGDFRN